MQRFAVAIAVSVIGISAAMAADLSVPAPPPRLAANYANWSGFYIGGNLGAGIANGNYVTPIGTSVSSSTGTSFVGGGQVGVNYEFDSVVVGAEGMFGWAPNANNTINLTSTPAGTSQGTVTLNNRWLTTVTGKLGYAWDRVLLYGKAGGAWTSISASNATIAGRTAPFSSPNLNSGYTAGFGVEWAFAGNWSARIEYDFIGLTDQTWTFAKTPATSFNSDSRSINIITVGLNYRFGSWW